MVKVRLGLGLVFGEINGSNPGFDLRKPGQGPRKKKVIEKQ